MRTVILKNETTIEINESYEGKPLEWILEEAITNNEPIESSSPEIFTDKKLGVMPEYDIRTDRFEIARETADYISKTSIAKRDSLKESSEPIQATETES